ncbi:MAG TPA: AvrD family protein [Amycolatopsis sp.]|uniref:AvrD family protein n=1 Tax=Amycolatopsis sp. TaxID=37632 RepID=UPI002B49B083|nr:AvrD family protein [Amycolatopsis sp.]HKS50144.1 AvrD family protein [Amycolatopsis sp.]
MSKKSVEDYLGEGEKRFFAAGYRRVAYRFGDIVAEVRDDRRGLLATSIRLSCPDGWSHKAARGALRPHLSTIDAILLAGQLGELYLTHACHLDEQARRRIWIRKLKIKAGASPDEELEQVPVSTRPVAASGDSSVVVLESRIGAMRTQCEFAGVTGEPNVGTTTYSGPEQLLGPAENRYYGTGFTGREQRLGDLSLDLPRRRATAAVTCAGDGGDSGLEGAYQPAPTFVDLFATSLQLAQILLYETDSMSRGESNTLWMRSTQLTAESPHRTFGGAMPLRTELHDLGLLTMNGAPWRTADIHAGLGGITLRCAVAHALPPGATAIPSEIISTAAESR